MARGGHPVYLLHLLHIIIVNDRRERGKFRVKYTEMRFFSRHWYSGSYGEIWGLSRKYRRRRSSKSIVGFTSHQVRLSPRETKRFRWKVCVLAFAPSARKVICPPRRLLNMYENENEISNGARNDHETIWNNSYEGEVTIFSMWVEDVAT